MYVYVYNVHNRTIWQYIYMNTILMVSVTHWFMINASLSLMADIFISVPWLTLFTSCDIWDCLQSCKASAGRDCSSQFSSSETDHVPGLARTNDVTGDKVRLLSVDLPLLQSQLWRGAPQSLPQSDLDISVDIPGLLEASRGYDTPSGNPHPDRGSSDPGE